MYNAAAFIAEAVASLQAQTTPVAEIVIVDDGSTDGGVAAIPADPRIRLVRKPHTGIADTVNRGVRAASGEYLAFLDADDRWVPDKLARQLAAFAGPERPDLVFACGRIFHSPELLRAGAVDGAVVAGVGKSSLLIPRETFLRVGYLPVGEGLHDFMGWYARVVDAGLRSLVLPDVLFERRIHGANDGILRRAAQRGNYFATLKQVLDRRRAGGATGPAA